MNQEAKKTLIFVGAALVIGIFGVAVQSRRPTTRAEVMKQVGVSMEGDARLKAVINRFARRAVVGLTASYGDGIVKLVSETVRGWDAQTITDRLERTVGRDLQYIRVNGTLVGGLVGLAIHTVDVVM